MKPAVKPTATESKEQQILRAIAMKRESFFQLILGNLLQNPSAVNVTRVSVSADMTEHRSFNVNEIVDVALAGADHAVELLYKVDQGGK